MQLDGLINIRLILLTLSVTISGIFSLFVITVPSSNSAQISIGSNVTGSTFPVIFKTFFDCSIDAVKSPYSSFIAKRYISPNDRDFSFPFVNL